MFTKEQIANYAEDGKTIEFIDIANLIRFAKYESEYESIIDKCIINSQNSDRLDYAARFRCIAKRLKKL